MKAEVFSHPGFYISVCMIVSAFSNMPKKVEKIFTGNAILQSENRSKRGDKNEKSERSHQSKRPYENL